jgi:GNAT superfamily N-acetyltransferase
MIRELAEFERLLDAVTATEPDLHEALFGSAPAAEALVAEGPDGPAGFALFFTTYSTFVGRPGIYVEDLYVRPSARGQGHGRRLMRQVVRLARERGCGRVEWAALVWNEPAIRFYRSLGARAMEEWRLFRLGRQGIERL